MQDKIREILGSLTVGGAPIPGVPVRYRGKAERYITWTITGEEPAIPGDDRCRTSIVSLDVDIFSTAEYSDIMEAVKQVMTAAGWVWVGCGPEMLEEETGIFHRTIEFEIERMT